MTVCIPRCKIQSQFIAMNSFFLHDGWSGLRDSDRAFMPDGCLWLRPPWLRFSLVLTICEWYASFYILSLCVNLCKRLILCDNAALRKLGS